MSKEGGSQEFFEVFKRPEELSSRKEPAPKKEKSAKRKVSRPSSDESGTSTEPGSSGETSSDVEATKGGPNIDQESQLPRITITLTQMQCVLMALLIFVSWALMFIFGQITAYPGGGRESVSRVSKGKQFNDSKKLSLDVANKSNRKSRQAAGTPQKQQYWTVQAITYSGSSHNSIVTRTRASLESQGYEVFQKDERKKIYIHVGKCSDKRRADQLAREIKDIEQGKEKPFKDCFVVRWSEPYR